MLFFTFVPMATIPACAQQVKPSAATDALGTLSDGLEAITARTMRCVVKIMADSYAPDQGYLALHLSTDPLGLRIRENRAFMRLRAGQVPIRFTPAR